MKQEKNVSGLIETLKSEDISKAYVAASSLGSIGEPAIQPLTDVLNTDKPGVQWMAAIALGKVGTSAVPALVNALASKGARIPAIWALAEIGDARAAPPLMEILEADNSECCRIVAAASLLKLGDSAGIEKVREICRKEGEQFSGMVLEAYCGT